MVRSAKRLCQLWLGMVFAVGCTSNSVEDHPINRAPASLPSATTQPAAQKPSPNPSPVSSGQTAKTVKRVNKTVRNARSTDGVPPSQDLPAVTSEDCADCHPDKVDGFRETGMGRSLYRPTKDNIIEDFRPDKATAVHPIHKVRYRAYIDDQGRWWQEESLDGTDYKKRVEVKYIVGSGNHTRSYLGEVGGNLTQMPLTWYTKKKIWDMSPGYESEFYHRFSRPVRAICLFCHNDLTPSQDGTRSTYKTDLAEGISCVRCHGDGRQHVAARRAGQNDTTIFNPKRESMERQLEICQQCHLAGKSRVLLDGHRWDSYDPKTRLADYMSIYSYKVDGGASFGIASHGNRLALSECFKNSGDKMNCTLCHDPHKKSVTLGRRTACLSCHKVDDCGDKHGSSQNQNCSSCHMYRGGTSDIPHVTFTDHFIRKKPAEEQNVKRGRSIELIDVLATRRKKDDPSRAAVRLAIAHARRWRLDGKSEHQAEALKQLESALAVEPNYPDAWNELAMLYKAKGQFNRAVSAFEKAEIHGPDVIEFWLDYAEVLEGMGRLAEAEIRLRKLIQRVPKEKGPWNNLANVLLKQNKLNEAEKAYDQAEKLDPSDAVTASNRGYFELKRGRYDAAEKWFTQALKNDGVNPMMYSNLGTLAIARKDLTKARTYFERSLARDRKFAIAYWMLGRLDVAAGQWKSAVSHFTKMTSVAPKDPRGYIELVGIHMARNNRKAALKVLIRAQIVMPANPYINRLLRQVQTQMPPPARQR